MSMVPCLLALPLNCLMLATLTLFSWSMGLRKNMGSRGKPAEPSADTPSPGGANSIWWMNRRQAWYNVSQSGDKVICLVSTNIVVKTLKRASFLFLDCLWKLPSYFPPRPQCLRHYHPHRHPDDCLHWRCWRTRLTCPALRPLWALPRPGRRRGKIAHSGSRSQCPWEKNRQAFWRTLYLAGHSTLCLLYHTSQKERIYCFTVPVVIEIFIDTTA